MNWYSYVAIYILFWFVCLFMVLPFGIRTHDELGIAKQPGQADSAPGNFQPWRVVLRTSILAALLMVLFVLNYRFGWVTMPRIGAPPPA